MALSELDRIRADRANIIFDVLPGEVEGRLEMAFDLSQYTIDHDIQVSHATPGELWKWVKQARSREIAAAMIQAAREIPLIVCKEVEL